MGPAVYAAAVAVTGPVPTVPLVRPTRQGSRCQSFTSECDLGQGPFVELGFAWYVSAHYIVRRRVWGGGRRGDADLHIKRGAETRDLAASDTGQPGQDPICAGLRPVVVGCPLPERWAQSRQM